MLIYFHKPSKSSTLFGRVAHASMIHCNIKKLIKHEYRRAEKINIQFSFVFYWVNTWFHKVFPIMSLMQRLKQVFYCCVVCCFFFCKYTTFIYTLKKMFSADENISQHNALLEGKARVFFHCFSCVIALSKSNAWTTLRWFLCLSLQLTRFKWYLFVFCSHG